MSAKVKGITIELSADTKGIETALKNVNKEISNTQKQLSSVNSSLKLNPGNTDLLEQKMRLLGQAIDQTKNKLTALKQAQQQVSAGMATGANNQSQYDALTREISDTTVKLNQLQQTQAQTNTALLSASGSTTAFQTGLQGISNAAMNVASKTAMISAAAGMALGGMIALGTESAQTADDLVTMANQTGLSTDYLQRLKYASESIDVPLDTINGAIMKMKGNLKNNEDAWKSIGVEVRNQNGEYKSIQQIFEETVHALGKIDNETQRDTESMKFFGKSAQELSGLIDDGGAALSRLGDEAESMGGIIPEETLERLASFNDKIKNMKFKIEVAGLQLALPILEALEPVINTVSTGLSMLAQVASSVPAPVIQIAMGMLALIAVIAPIALGIASVTNALTALIGILPGVGVAFGQMASAMTSALAANPYIVAVVAIIGVLALLAYAVAEIIMHYDELKAGGQSAFNDLKQAAAPVGAKFNEIKEAAKNGLSQIPSLISKAANAFSKLQQAAKSAVSAVVTVFQQLMSKAFSLGKDIMGAFTSGISSAIDEVTASLQRLVNQVVSILSGAAFQAGMAGQAAGSAYASSFNSSASQITTPTVTATSVSAVGSSSGSVAALTTAVNTLSAQMSSGNSSGTNVTVELVGSASNIFDTVRVENNKLQTATGFHALA